MEDLYLLNKLEELKLKSLNYQNEVYNLKNKVIMFKKALANFEQTIDNCRLEKTYKTKPTVAKNAVMYILPNNQHSIAS